MSPTAPVREGDVIAGKYRVERVLGAGGMGVVVAARHLELKQRVAIKFLLGDAMTKPETMLRFFQEAQSAAKIQSEHVARVIDVARMDKGLPYIVMEFLEGKDLAAVLSQRGPLPLEETVGYVLEACEGIAEAHANRIVHRDIKPSNLFVSERGAGRKTVKVLDFGISKSPHVTDTGRELGLTKSSAVMGSPLYMSPEQMSSSKHVDGRADIWSLGVTLFELLAGKTPFHGESITELIATVLQNPPLPLRQLRPDLPPGIEVALLKSLEKKRESRYQTILAFAEAVAPFGNRHASYHLERISQVLGTAPSVATSAGSVDTPSLALAQTEQVALAETQPLGLAATEPVQPTGGQATASAWGAGNRSSGERARRRGGRVAVGAFAVVGVIAAAGGGIYWAAANRPGRADTSAAAMLPAASNALLAAATPVASNLGGPSLAPSTPASSAAASNPAIRIDADASAAGMGQASPPRRPPVAGPGPARPNGGSAAPPVPAASPAAPTATARTNTGNPVTDMGVH